MIAHDLKMIADTLSAHRAEAWYWPLVGLVVPSMQRRDLHTLVAALREIAERIEALERLPVPEVAREPERLRCVWSRP